MNGLPRALGRGNSASSVRRRNIPGLLLLLGALLPALTSADCECGYSSTIGHGTQEYVFTDLIESNFAEVQDISQDTDWVRQAYNLTAATARGTYGEMFDIDNIVANPTTDKSNDLGTGSDGSSAGLELTVGSQLVDGMVSVAEIDTHRLDVYWGSFRASMKLTNISGTCAAFFWYFNDTQEIDMEFLSSEFNTSNNSYPVNLVLQSREAAEAGYNAALTGNFLKAYLPFNPTLDFHEYRMDYIPGQVFFYADGKILAEMNGSAVPTSPGHLILEHWSNGNTGWSGGPPLENATLAVNYVKAYFNSSTPARIQDYATRCVNPTATNAICAIPNLDATNTTNTSSPGWFFSGQSNMTNNQTVYNSGGHATSFERVRWFMIATLSFAAGLAFGVW